VQWIFSVIKLKLFIFFLSYIRILCSAIFIFSFFISSSQDTITKISGDVIVAKIIEVGTTEIKYKRFDMQDGPDFVDLKSNIKTIRYENGLVEDLQPVKPKAEVKSVTTVPVESTKIEPLGKRFKCGDIYLKEMKMYKFALQKNDETLTKAIKKAKSSKWKKYFIFGMIPFGAATAGYYAIYKVYADPTSSLYNPDLASAALFDSYTNAAITIACGTIGMTYTILHKKHNKRVVDIYNALP
jgi:hypothetical protein